MITQEYLKSILEYNSESGNFYWRVQKASKIKIGQIAGSKNFYGYIHIHIDQKKYPAHRLVWLYVYGKFPTHQIDHINHIKSDNRFCNLREATQSQNKMNTLPRIYQTKGVLKRKNRWETGIKKDGIRYHIGHFKTKLEAAAAYNKKALEFYGNFAHLNDLDKIEKEEVINNGK